MKLKDIMTTDVHVIPPNINLVECARKMKELDVGALPICHNDRITGLLTDRDLVIKALSEARDIHSTTAQDVMSSPVVFCYEDEDVESAVRLMEVKQIRRLIVLNRQKRLVGIVTLGDVAAKNDNLSLAGEVLEKVSEPIHGRQSKAA